MKLNHLLVSRRWMDFLESTASGLQLNLAFRSGTAPAHWVQVPQACPDCNRIYPLPAATDRAAARKSVSRSKTPSREEQIFITPDSEPAVTLKVRDGLLLIARECPCKAGQALPPLSQRAEAAQKLLNTFLTTLTEGFPGGHTELGFSALRQMNRILLSSFRGESEAARRAFDLILSALIIMSDAEAGWLVFRDESGEQQVFKGDPEALVAHLRLKAPDDILKVEVRGANIKGHLSLLRPANPEFAAGILQLMAQECSIVFEVEHLFRLMQSQLSWLFGALNSAVILINEHLQIAYLNPAAETILAQTAFALIGASIEVLPPCWRELIRNRIATQVSGFRTLHYRNGGSLLIDWRILPLHDDALIAGWLIIAADRTDSYHWQEIGRQSESFSTVASVINPLAHQLRNPLAAAKGLLQLMERRREPAKTPEYISLILDEIDRMSLLVNEFLQIGRSTNGRFESVALDGLVRELLPLVQGEAASAEIEINCNLEPVPPITADPGQLVQVLLNLIHNAFEAAEPGGRVELILKSQGDWVVLEVRDNGPGIKAELLDKLFQPFVTTKERGKGLGLAISKAIITNHYGKITAANLPVRGAVFSIKLPVERETRKSPHPIDVLLAVGDGMITYPVEQVLHAAGFTTRTTKSIAEIGDLAELCRPAILILDPAVTAEQLQGIGRIWPKAKILMTGEPKFPDISPEIGILPKPIDYGRLIELVRSMAGINPPSLTQTNDGIH